MYVHSVRVLNLEKYQFSFQWLGILGVSPTHSFFWREPNKSEALKSGEVGKRFVFISRD